MKKQFFYSYCLVALAVIALGLCSSCTTPYDATGSYTGKWSFKDNATKIDDNQTDNATGKTIDCPLTMTLVQNATATPTDNASVSGTVHIIYDCLAETSVWPIGGVVPAPVDVTVSGVMDPKGKLTLVSAGCGPGTCAILLLDGQAESDTKTGGTQVMTLYSGNWGFAVGIAFLGNFGVSGTFEVERNPD